MTHATSPVVEGGRAPAWLSRRVPIAWVQLGVVLIALAGISLAKTVDPDFWWHLRTGRLIVESGMPRHDPFSWTAAGKAWVTHEWLAEVVIYGVESTLGYVGNVVVFGAVVAAAIATMYALGRRLGAGTRPLVLLSFLAAFALIGFVSVRPQEFTWLLFAVFVYILQRHDEGDAAPLWVLPPLMALWANLHLGFFFGLMVVAIWAAVQVLRRFRSGIMALRTPLTVAGACVIATLANPSAFKILTYPAAYLSQGNAQRSLILEWQHPDFTSPKVVPIAATLLLLGICLLFQRRRPFLAILSVIFVALSLQAVRNVPFAVLLTFPVVGSAVADRWPIARRERDSHTTVPLAIGAGLLTAVPVCVFAAAMAIGSPVSGFSPSEEDYPAAGASYVAENHPDARLFNSYDWGGYLIDRLYPGVLVFMDGREEFYGNEIFSDYLKAAMVDEGWKDVLSRYGVDLVLIKKGSELATALRSDSEWQEEFTGPLESVFVRE